MILVSLKTLLQSNPDNPGTATNGSMLKLVDSESKPVPAEMNPEEDDSKNKSERKRQREKQRRSELTNAFDDLASWVLQYDAEDGDKDGNGDSRKKSRRLSSRNDDNDTGGMTRVDLIARALGIMKRLQRENTDLKQRLASGDGGGKTEVSLRFLIFWFGQNLSTQLLSILFFVYLFEKTGNGNGSYFDSSRGRLS